MWGVGGGGDGMGGFLGGCCCSSLWAGMHFVLQSCQFCVQSTGSRLERNRCEEQGRMLGLIKDQR